MRYLKSVRGCVILACFVLSSLLLTALPGIDIFISKVFFDGTFHLREQWWPRLLHDGLTYFLIAALVSVVGLYACNRLLKRNIFCVDGRKVLYLFLVLILGAGLIVNVGFKDHFGRARPRDVAEFGGSKAFTPAFVVSRECDKNCSFSSGDGAGGFFCLALAMALSKRRRIFLAGITAGILVSLARIASGAHFFSDAVVSFFVMLIVADVLYFYMVLTSSEREQLLRAPVVARSGVEPATG